VTAGSIDARPDLLLPNLDLTRRADTVVKLFNELPDTLLALVYFYTGFLFSRKDRLVAGNGGGFISKARHMSKTANTVAQQPAIVNTRVAFIVHDAIEVNTLV
jgi:hypothetical protein